MSYIAIVEKDGKEKFRSEPTEYASGACFAAAWYILKHQTQSVNWATKYGGWRVEVKETEETDNATPH